ncbi:YgaP family membrane protein [Halomicrobium urmianum]|uniref:YgaP family membrane protein n=1 Tax=Halomicrobium urmianum TaxID=1586233 RepID=UPI001CD94760|nr:DUF2892 domain-containing protein [Halomicrobium urmianum]
MEKNVGGYDRIARLVVGPILLLVAVAVLAGVVTVTGLLGAALIVGALLVGLVLLVTGFTQRCPLNDVLGIDTYRGRQDEPGEDVDVGRAQ